ncbi:MAG: SCO1664 family protein [Anaerolineae bacterium]|nr:SCO1664 family protein [Anaerolineae bacterium]
MAQTSGVSLPADCDRVLRILRNGTMREAHGMLRWSSNSAFLVSIADGDLTLLTVYKPQRGERPLWDFPEGTLCYREAAAFTMSQALGWQIVPPTIVRDGLRGVGSVQFYVEHNPEENYFTLDEQHVEPLMRFAAFDYIVNNADRKGGHCLLDDQRHLWGIDHGICFHVAPKLRTVIWDFAGQPVPPALLQDVERVYCGLEERNSPLRAEMDSLLADAEIQALLARMRRILQRREYPRPGPGPNYPWPPV